MADGHGFADYMLFVEGKAVGVLEAKPAGYPGSNSCQAASTNPRNSMFNAGGVPKGSSWNQLLGWLKAMDALRIDDIRRVC